METRTYENYNMMKMRSQKLIRILMEKALVKNRPSTLNGDVNSEISFQTPQKQIG